MVYDPLAMMPGRIRLVVLLQALANQLEFCLCGGPALLALQCFSNSLPSHVPERVHLWIACQDSARGGEDRGWARALASS